MGVGYRKSGPLAYKTRNISETAEDRAKVTINGLYKVVYELSITAKIYTARRSIQSVELPS